MEANKEAVHAYFDSDAVVDYYASAAGRVGLWESEEKIFRRLFQPEDTLLELGWTPLRYHCLWVPLW